MTVKSHAEALADALHERLIADPQTFIVGSYVFGLGPARVHMDRIRDAFPDRVFDPPSAEAAMVALAAGAATAGGRPFVSIGTAAFSLVAFSALVNEAANMHLQSGGRTKAPGVFHMLHGVRAGAAPQHATSPQAMLWNSPGLEIVLPATPADAKGLMATALASDNPTVVIDHARLLPAEGEVPDMTEPVPFGQGVVRRAGSGVTIVATSFTVHTALEAARRLSSEGIEAEVWDPRTLVPFDDAGLAASVAKTGRLVVADECPLPCSVASEIAARAAEHCFADLKAPIRRVARPPIPAPFSAPLEEMMLPSADRIAEAARTLLA